MRYCEFCDEDDIYRPPTPRSIPGTYEARNLRYRVLDDAMAKILEDAWIFGTKEHYVRCIMEGIKAERILEYVAV
jgi:hypothetical protein